MDKGVGNGVDKGSPPDVKDIKAESTPNPVQEPLLERKDSDPDDPITGDRLVEDTKAALAKKRFLNCLDVGNKAFSKYPKGFDVGKKSVLVNTLKVLSLQKGSL